jgi:hypothetical protein
MVRVSTNSRSFLRGHSQGPPCYAARWSIEEKVHQANEKDANSHRYSNAIDACTAGCTGAWLVHRLNLAVADSRRTRGTAPTFHVGARVRALSSLSLSLQVSLLSKFHHTIIARTIMDIISDENIGDTLRNVDHPNLARLLDSLRSESTPGQHENLVDLVQAYFVLSTDDSDAIIVACGDLAEALLASS